MPNVRSQVSWKRLEILRCSRIQRLWHVWEDMLAVSHSQRLEDHKAEYFWHFWTPAMFEAPKREQCRVYLESTLRPRLCGSSWRFGIDPTGRAAWHWKAQHVTFKFSPSMFQFVSILLVFSWITFQEAHSMSRCRSPSSCSYRFAMEYFCRGCWIKIHRRPQKGWLEV